MPFSIAMSNPFGVASQNGKGLIQIVDRKDGVEIPAAFFQPHAAMTADEAKAMAANIKDFLNGAALLYRIGRQGRTMLYAVLPNGLSLRFHEQDAKGASTGNSVEAATLTFSQDYLPVFQQFAQTPDAFKAIMVSGSMEERRKEPRAHKTRTARGVTPPPAPRA